MGTLSVKRPVMPGRTRSTTNGGTLGCPSTAQGFPCLLSIVPTCPRALYRGATHKELRANFPLLVTAQGPSLVERTRINPENSTSEPREIQVLLSRAELISIQNLAGHRTYFTARRCLIPVSG